MPKLPSAQPVPRVPRSRRDDLFPKSHPVCPKRAGAAVVTSRQGDTVTVLSLDEELPGVIPLGSMPPIGSIVEVESRCELLVILDWDHSTDGYLSLGDWYFTSAESPRWEEGESDSPYGVGERVTTDEAEDRGLLWNRQDFSVYEGDRLSFSMLVSNLLEEGEEPLPTECTYLSAQQPTRTPNQQYGNTIYALYESVLTAGTSGWITNQPKNLWSYAIVQDSGYAHTTLPGYPRLRISTHLHGRPSSPPYAAWASSVIVPSSGGQPEGEIVGFGVYLRGSSTDDGLPQTTSTGKWGVTDPSACAFYWGQKIASTLDDRDEPAGPLDPGEGGVPTVQLVLRYDGGGVVAYGPEVAVNSQLIEFTASATVPSGVSQARLGLRYTGSGALDVLMQAEALTQDAGPAAVGINPLIVGGAPGPATEHELVARGGWVQRYAGDGTQLAEAGASQGLLGESGHERSLVGFDFPLPADAEVWMVRLRVPWESWAYANNLGSLVLGWHDHHASSAPAEWTVGAGESQLTDHDVRADETVDLVLGWAPAVVQSGSFGGLVVGPGYNDSPLYSGHTSVDAGQWTLTISYRSAEVA